MHVPPPEVRTGDSNRRLPSSNFLPSAVHRPTEAFDDAKAAAAHAHVAMVPLPDLTDLIEAAGREVGAAEALTLQLAKRLVALALSNTARFLAYDNEGIGSADRTSASGLYDRIVLAGAADALADDGDSATLVTALFRQIRRAHQQLNQAPAASPSVPAAAPAPAAASDPEAKSKADTLTCYATLASLQGRQFELNERATFVGAAHSDVVKYGHITTVPSVKDVKVLGTTSTQRQRVGFANPANNASSVVATMEFNGITASVDPHDDAKIRASTRHLVHGLLAALGGEIGAAHYGGRDVGWVTPPGRTVQVRVGASASAFDKWMWEVVSSPLRGPAYLRMVDHNVGDFLVRHARQEQLADEVLESMRAAAADRYTKDPDPPRADDASSSLSSGQSSLGDSASAAGANAGPAGEARGECLSWLTNGNCSREVCPFPHSNGRRGMASNRGRAQKRSTSEWEWNAPHHVKILAIPPFEPLRAQTRKLRALSVLKYGAGCLDMRVAHAALR